MTTKMLRACTFLDKGGTGKTTSTAHLAVACAREGLNVLAIDLAGKQGDLTKHFELWEDVQEEIEAEEDWPNIATVFQNQWDTIADKLGSDAVDDLILETDEGVDIIPAHPGLDGLDEKLGNVDGAEDRYSRLDDFLSNYVDSRDYDIVFIDLPGLTNNVSYNGLWAAENIIAPVEMGPFEAEQAGALHQDIESLNESHDVDIRLQLVLPNKVDTRTNLGEEYLSSYTEEYPQAIAPEYVPYSQDIRNATENGHTAFALDKPSTTAEQALDAYTRGAHVLVERLEVRQ